MSCLVYKFAPCLDRLSFILVAFLRRVMHLGKSAFIKFVFIQNQRKLPTQKRQSNTIFLFFVPVLENWSDTNHLCINNSRRNTTHSSLNENRAANVVNHHENLHLLKFRWISCNDTKRLLLIQPGWNIMTLVKHKDLKVFLNEFKSFYA